MTYDPNGGTFRGSKKPTDVEVLKGKKTKIAEAPTRDHYRFLGWGLKKGAAADELLKPGTEFTPDGDTTLFAIWEPIKCKIIYNPNGGVLRGKTESTIITYTEGETIEIIEAPTREGYEFLYWKGSMYNPGDPYKVENDHLFIAQWKKIEKPVGPVDPDEPDKPGKKTDNSDKSKKKSKSDEHPDTGDQFNILFWLILLASMPMLMFELRRRREMQ